MRKLKYLLLLLAPAVFLFGCNDDFLNRVPETDISAPDFWKTDNDLELYVNQIYFDLGKNGYTLDDGSDNAISNGGISSWLDGQNQITTDVISKDYQYIWDVNTMIANMNKVTDSTANQFKGEAYFLRAWFYFDILQNVGAAQIVKSPLGVNDQGLYVLRSRRDSVADFILSDLDSAIFRLKPRSALVTSGDGQRISRDAALAMESRVALFEGSWEKYHQGDPFDVSNPNPNKYFQKCVTASKALMDNYGYTLDDDYASVFSDITVSGTQIPVKEIIFARQFSTQLYGTGNSQFSQPYLNQWPNRVGYTRGAIRSYLCTDGLPISVSPLYAGDMSLANITKNRDPRLAMSVFVPGDPYNISAATGDTNRFVNPFTTVDATAQAEPTGYTSRKFYNYSLAFNNAKSGDPVTIYFRYGEVLLNYAEAAAELGQFDQAAADASINKLRDRASVHMPHLIVGAIVADPDWPDWGYSLSPLLEEIRRERRVELLGEDFRFDDLRRWAAASLIIGQNYRGAYFEAIMNNGAGKTEPKDADNYFEPFQKSLPGGYQFNPGRDYLEPYPQTQLVLNPKLAQNPGW